MSIASPMYAPPIRRRVDAVTQDYELIDAATERFEAGDFLDAVHKVFAHVMPGVAIDLAAAPATFVQGSSRVTARIDDGIFTLSCPLVRLPAGGGAVAALRYVLSRINGSGQLFQARLRGDDLFLEMKEKISALHPQKLLEVVRRMPSVADQHDDWMVTQFGAIELDRAPIEPVSDAELAAAWELWQTHWRDAEELLKEAQRKRSTWFLNEATSFVLTRIRFALPLCGGVLPRLLESGRTFNDSDVDPMKRETSLAKCIKEMKAVTREELGKSLGHAVYALSPMAEGTPQKLSGFFGPGSYMETIDKYRAGGQVVDAALALAGTCYYLLAHHSWPLEVEEAIQAGLAEASGKPWRDAANSLFAHARTLVEQFGGDDEEGDEDDDEDDGEEGSDDEEGSDE